MTAQTAAGAAAPKPAESAVNEKLAALFDQLATRYIATADDDRSNSSQYGITKAMLADWLNRTKVTVDEVKAVTPELAKQILYERYWRPIAADYLPEPIAAAIFDIAITRGTEVAGKLLQRGIKSATGMRIKIDGAVAQQTLKAITEHADPIGIAEQILAKRSTLVWRLGDGLILGQKPLVALARAAIFAGRVAMIVG